MVEQVFLPVGEVWFMHNVNTQFTMWRGRGQRAEVFLKFIFIFGCSGSLWLNMGYSLLAVSRIYSSLCCSGFLLWWLRLLQSWGCRHLGLDTPGLVESSWTRDWTCVSCIGRWILIHCTTRKVQEKNFSCLAINVNFISQKQSSKFDTLYDSFCMKL